MKYVEVALIVVGFIFIAACNLELYTIILRTLSSDLFEKLPSKHSLLVETSNSIYFC